MSEPDTVIWCDEMEGRRVVMTPSGLCVPEYRLGTDKDDTPPMWISSGSWEELWTSGSSWEEIVCGMAQDCAAANSAVDGVMAQNATQAAALATARRDLEAATEASIALAAQAQQALYRLEAARALLGELLTEISNGGKMTDCASPDAPPCGHCWVCRIADFLGAGGGG